MSVASGPVQPHSCRNCPPGFVPADHHCESCVDFQNGRKGVLDSIDHVLMSKHLEDQAPYMHLRQTGRHRCETTGMPIQTYDLPKGYRLLFDRALLRPVYMPYEDSPYMGIDELPMLYLGDSSMARSTLGWKARTFAQRMEAEKTARNKYVLDLAVARKLLDVYLSQGDEVGILNAMAEVEKITARERDAYLSLESCAYPRSGTNGHQVFFLREVVCYAFDRMDYLAEEKKRRVAAGNDSLSNAIAAYFASPDETDDDHGFAPFPASRVSLPRMTVMTAVDIAMNREEPAKDQTAS